MGHAAVLAPPPYLEHAPAEASTAPPPPVREPSTTDVSRPAIVPEGASVDQLLPLVRSIARMVSHTLPPVVELDDLVHDGVVGLLECARRYDPARGVDFPTYASYRIRGAILDGLRARDPLSRSARRALKATERQTADGADSTRCPPRPLPPVTQLLNLEDAGSLSQEGMEPEARLLALEFGQTLRRAVAALAARDREVLYFRFTRGWRLREVAAHYGISITRVAEVQDRAIRRLRLALEVPRTADLSPNGRRRRSRSR